MMLPQDVKGGAVSALGYAYGGFGGPFADRGKRPLSSLQETPR